MNSILLKNGLWFVLLLITGQMFGQIGIYMTQDDMANKKLTPVEFISVTHPLAFQLNVKIDGKKKSFKFNEVFGFVYTDGSIYRTQSMTDGQLWPYMYIGSGDNFLWGGMGGQPYISETLAGPAYKVNEETMDQLGNEHPKLRAFFDCCQSKEKDAKRNRYDIYKECIKHGGGEAPAKAH